MPAPCTIELQAAKSEVLARLLKIVRESPSETQVRLAAAVILRLPIPKEPESPQAVEHSRTAHAAPRTDQPLTPAELADLTRHLPQVSPSRFTKKHTPAYWRAVLEQHRAAAAHAPPVRAAA